MGTRSWNNVVTIEIGGERKSYARINTTRGAASYLIDQWPGERDSAYTDAIVSCTKALKGEIDDRSAMSAFIHAASISGLRYMSSPASRSLHDDFELSMMEATMQSIAADLEGPKSLIQSN